MDSEAARLLKRKEECAAWLAQEPLKEYRLALADPRLEAYAASVAAAPADHCVWELLSLRRFLTFCRRYGLDAAACRRFYAFYESLSLPGQQGLTRYSLTPVQCFQFASVYGFHTPEGRRLTREAVLFVPRKFSKTTSSAAFAVYDLLFGDSNAESYTCANSEDQAKKCFDVIRGIVRRLDPRARRYLVNEKTIKSRRLDRTAFCQCLTANARTKDGLNASTVIMDEFSQARDRSLLDVMTTSMAARRDPLTVIITTASQVFEGPFHAMLQGYKHVLLGEVEDDSLFAHLFEPDPGDAEGDPRTWRKVQPHLGVTVSPDFYATEYQKALRGGSAAMLAFRTKLLNQYAAGQSGGAWITGDLALRLMRPLRLADFAPARPDGMCAIDLSESDDFSAVSVGVYDPSRKEFLFHTAYFFPEGALPRHPNERLYRAWAAAGHLQLLSGEVIDYRAIVEYILKANESVRLLRIGYDPYKSQEVVNMLRASGAGGVVTPVRQNYGTFTAPCESFEHGAKTGRIFINDNPINAWCFANAVLDVDRMENMKPVKRSRYQKIDGVITMLMCLQEFITFER